MPNHLPLKPAGHLDYLDTARGIAAIMVMAGHYIGWTHKYDRTVNFVAFVFNASDAVSFFFVLSGFVLSYKYIVLGAPLTINRFYVNRLFRLWPAFFVTVVINTLNGLYYSGITIHSLSATFLLNENKFWEEALLVWTRPNHFGPGWTLLIELAASFFLPFMVALAKKDIRYLYWMTFVFLLFGPAMVNMFYFHFVMGVLLSCHFDHITSNSFKSTVWYRYRLAIVPLACLLFSIRSFARLAPLGPTYTYLSDYLGISLFHYSAIASVIFIVVLLRSPILQKILCIRALLFIGRIAYGIYLMHWLLVNDIFLFWNKITPYFQTEKQAFVIVFFLYTAATILLAAILHFTVEKPFIKIGKRIASKMKPSLTIE